MKKVAFVCALVLVACLFSVPVYAADDDGGGFWGVISIIGDLIMNLWDSIIWLLQGIVEGLAYLFIPSEGYFSALFQRLADAFSSKVGSVFSLILYLKDAFAGLKAYKNTDTLFLLEFPQSHFLSGWKMDIMANGQGFLSLFRAGLSGSISVATGIYVYKRVIAIVKT